MKQNFIKYQDKHKCWQRHVLLNVTYFRDLEVETYEELLIHLNHVNYYEGETILQ